jgi:phosphoheptose isomerase
MTIRFPDRIYDDAGDYADDYLSLLAEASRSVSRTEIHAAARLIVEATLAGRRVYSCGNGGSAAIANHLVCDCLKGIRTDTQLRPRVYSLSATVELVTAIVNDIGVEAMFAYQLESLGEEGDVLIAISSSGTSPNVVAAVRAAQECGMNVIAMTGFSGGPTAELADVSLHVKCGNYGMIEDTHQSLMHILAQYCRNSSLSIPDAVSKVKF